MPHQNKGPQTRLRIDMSRMLTPVLLLCGAVIASGQQAPAKQQPAARQPSLTVDRDPAPSPDVDPPAQSQTGTPQGVGLAKIEREGGKYTLRTDAYEVRLNATVLDEAAGRFRH
jgi:hypothetical protein